MSNQVKKMSEMLIEMAEVIYAVPEDEISDGAITVAMVLAHYAWDESIGIIRNKDRLRYIWQEVEADYPDLWDDLKSANSGTLIDEMVEYKQSHFPDDLRRIMLCGVTNGKFRVEWLPPVEPGVDAEWEVDLYTKVRFGLRKEAIEDLKETQKMTLAKAKKEVSKIEEKLSIPMALYPLTGH